MIVVGDASPLIGLSAVRRLDLLRQLYAEVLIPEAVRDEVRALPNAPGAADLLAAEWIRVHPLNDTRLLRALAGELDPGEAEAIALAAEVGADLLLIDERRGRASAKRLGLRVVGVLGVLVEAKEKGLLPAIRPVIDALVYETGFYLSDALRRSVLDRVGE